MARLELKNLADISSYQTLSPYNIRKVILLAQSLLNKWAPVGVILLWQFMPPLGVLGFILCRRDHTVDRLHLEVSFG